MTNPDAAAAVLALLTADTNITVYDTVVPPAPLRPYVVVYAPVGRSTVNNLTGNSGALEATIQTTSVGDTAESCRIVARRVKAALLDVRPTIIGRVSFPIRHEDSLPPQVDNQVQPPVLFAVDRWLTQSVPA